MSYDATGIMPGTLDGTVYDEVLYLCPSRIAERGAVVSITRLEVERQLMAVAVEGTLEGMVRSAYHGADGDVGIEPEE